MSINLQNNHIQYIGVCLYFHHFAIMYKSIWKNAIWKCNMFNKVIILSLHIVYLAMCKIKAWSVKELFSHCWRWIGFIAIALYCKFSFRFAIHFIEFSSVDISLLDFQLRCSTWLHRVDFKIIVRFDTFNMMREKNIPYFFIYI